MFWARTFSTRTIQSKLRMIVALTVVVALLPACAAILVYDRLETRASMLRDVTTLAGIFGSNSAAALSFEDAKTAAELLAGLRAKPSIDAAVLYQPDGKVLAAYRRAGTPIRPAPPLRQFGSWFEPGFLKLVDGIRFRGEMVGAIYLESNLAEAERRQRSFAGMVVVLLLLTSAMAFLLTSRLQKAVSGPISQLAATAKAVSDGGNYSVRALKEAEDDLGQLVDTFNGMLSEIERRDRELIQHRANLEGEVSARTSELQSANGDLIEARNKAEAASLAKSQFLANMSHEIRTPMNGIIGMTEFLMDSGLVGDQREFASTVKSSAESLLGIINDILDFSKIEAGRMELDPVSMSVHQTVEETLRASAFRAHEKGIELIGEVDPDVPEQVVADPVRIRQIITNLVGNAVKFTSRGEVAVTVRRDEEGLLRFAVRDTGVGIPADKHGAIFEAFAQADGSTTRRFGGTGLGLTICKRLAEAMGGRIWLESEVGKGSCFYFTVAFEEAREPVRPVAPRLPSGLRALVVDDNETNRRVLTDLLRSWAGQPEAAASGTEALYKLSQAVAEGRTYDLVITDVHMPGMDGFEFVEKLRELPEADAAATPVVMLSSVDHRGMTSRSRDMGVAAFVTKPVRRDDLQMVVARSISSAALAEGEAPIEVAQSLRGQTTSPLPLDILLVEDNIVNQRVALRLLERNGHRVDLATNGIEAIRRLEFGRYDLVLMDVQMPEMDGLETTRRIRASEAERGDGRHLPIVAMTANAMSGDRDRCLAAGMDDYISKPVRSADLIAMVARFGQGAYCHL